MQMTPIKFSVGTWGLPDESTPFYKQQWELIAEVRFLLYLFCCSTCLHAGDSWGQRHHAARPSVRPSVHPSGRLSHQEIWATLWGNLFKFGTKVHLDAIVNWLDLGGQRSLWPHTTHHILRRNVLILIKFHTNVSEDKTMTWWRFNHLTLIFGITLKLCSLQRSAGLKMFVKRQHFTICTKIHIWSIVVQHKLIDFTDVELHVIVVAPCDEAFSQSTGTTRKKHTSDLLLNSFFTAYI